jgi:hypothetical protein
MVMIAPVSVGMRVVVEGVGGCDVEGGVKDHDNQDASAALQVEPGQYERADEQAEIEPDEADGGHCPVGGGCG